MLTFTQLRQNLEYRIGDKSNSLVQKSRGIQDQGIFHEIALCNRLYKFIAGYTEGGTYSENVLDIYQEALLKVNNYLGTNLAYEFS